MEDEELEEFTSLSDEAGEISKHDLIVQTKKSSFWKGNLDLKNKPSGHSTKVSILYQIRIFYSFICKTSRNRNKSSYPYGVDIFGNIVTKKNVFSTFGNRKCCILDFYSNAFFLLQVNKENTLRHIQIYKKGNNETFQMKILIENLK